MKKTIFYWGIVLFCACTNTKSNDSRSEGNIKSSFSLRQILAINDLNKDIEYRKQKQSKADIGDFNALFNLKDYTIIPLDYRILNEEKFYQDPIPEILETCFEQDSSNLYFEGKKDNKTVFLLSMNHFNDHWIIRHFSPNWGKSISWLPDKLISAGTKEYTLLMGMNLSQLRQITKSNILTSGDVNIVGTNYVRSF